jgi:hypothetical protein
MMTLTLLTLIGDSLWTGPVVFSAFVGSLGFLIAVINLAITILREFPISYQIGLERKVDEHDRMTFAAIVTNTGKRTFTIHRAELVFEDGTTSVSGAKPVVMTPGQREVLEVDQLAVFFTTKLVVHVSPGKSKSVPLPQFEKKYQAGAEKILESIGKKGGPFHLTRRENEPQFGTDSVYFPINPIELTLSRDRYVGRRSTSPEERKVLAAICAHLASNHSEYFWPSERGGDPYLMWTPDIMNFFMK